MPMNAAGRIGTDDVLRGSCSHGPIKKPLLSTTSMTLSDATRLIGSEPLPAPRGRPRLWRALEHVRRRAASTR
jgi:hypothetical protein